MCKTRKRLLGHSGTVRLITACAGEYSSVVLAVRPGKVCVSDALHDVRHTGGTVQIGRTDMAGHEQRPGWIYTCVNACSAACEQAGPLADCSTELATGGMASSSSAPAEQARQLQAARQRNQALKEEVRQLSELARLREVCAPIRGCSAVHCVHACSCMRCLMIAALEHTAGEHPVAAADGSHSGRSGQLHSRSPEFQTWWRARLQCSTSSISGKHRNTPLSPPKVAPASARNSPPFHLALMSLPCLWHAQTSECTHS